MSLAELYRLCRKNVRLLALFLVVGLVLSGAYLLLKKPTYTVSATGIVNISVAKDAKVSSKDQLSLASSATSLAVAKTKTYIPLISEQATAEQIKENLNLDVNPEEISSWLTAKLGKDSYSFVVTAGAPSAETAQKVADEAIKVLSNRVQESDGKSIPITVDLLSSAELTKPVRSPEIIPVIAFGLLAALIAGVLYLVLRGRFTAKKVVETKILDDSETVLLAEVGHIEDHTAVNSEIRRAVALVQNLPAIRGVRSMFITSAVPGSGKTTIAEQIGRAFAAAGEKVLLVDADSRNSDLTKKFELEGKNGLSEALYEEIELDKIKFKTNVTNLSVVPVGKQADQLESLISAKRVTSLLERIQKDYVVVIDGSELYDTASAVVLANRADANILVYNPEVDHVEKTATLLKTNVAQFLGLILNEVNRDGRADA